MEKELILNITMFFISYIVFLLIYILIVNRKRKVYKEGKKQAEISYIINKFNLDMRITKYNTLKWILTFINPLIISITYIIVTNVESIVLGSIVGFLIMILLVYSSYEIIGRLLKRREKKCIIQKT